VEGLQQRVSGWLVGWWVGFAFIALESLSGGGFGRIRAESGELRERGWPQATAQSRNRRHRHPTPATPRLLTPGSANSTHGRTHCINTFKGFTCDCGDGYMRVTDKVSGL